MCQGVDIDSDWLAGEPSEEFLFVEAILEGLAAVDKDNRNFIVELAAQFYIGVDIDLVPCEASASRQLFETFFHNFAQMTPLARIDHDAAGLWHAGRF